MKASGLSEIWIEGGLLGPNSAERAMAGKDYNRAIRGHKLTSQALWRIVMPQFLVFVQTKDTGLYEELICQREDTGNIMDLITVLRDDRFKELMAEYVASRPSPTFKFWWQYLEMVEILLQFTRAQRDDIWSLYLFSFRCMLPFFMRYDHSNYARWGSVFLADAHQLPEAVYQEFQNGNFVVKRSAQKFNQVDPDQSQEWLNGTGKRSGGIVGITKTPTALSR